MVLPNSINSFLDEKEIRYLENNPTFILRSLYDRILKSNFNPPIKELLKGKTHVIFRNDSDGDNTNPFYHSPKDGVYVTIHYRNLDEFNGDIKTKDRFFSPLMNLEIEFKFRLIKSKGIFKKTGHVEFTGKIEPFENFYQFTEQEVIDKHNSTYYKIKSELDYPVYQINTKNENLSSNTFIKYSIDDLINLPTYKTVDGIQKPEDPEKGVVNFNLEGINTLLNHQKLVSSCGVSSLKVILENLFEVLSIDLKNLIELNIQKEQDIIKEREETKKRVLSIILKEFDKNQNGSLDIIEGENLLLQLLNKNQSTIIDFDHNLLKSLVRLNNFLNTKSENLNTLFGVLKKVETFEEVEEVVNLLRIGIDNYQSLLIHSLNMVVSLKEKDLLNYYNIYETFDKLGVFESNYERNVFTILTNINSSLMMVNVNLSILQDDIKNLTDQMKSMETNISDQLNNLTEVTKDSIESLNSSLTKELKSIKSGVELNNLLTGISTYQLYKINKNTRSLRS